MDEVELDVENYDTNLCLDNSRYHATTEFNNYFIIHMELFIFYSLYELFFGIILFYSLYENRKPAFASFTNYYLQAQRHNYRIPRIICRSLTNQNGDRTHSE